MNIDKNNFEVKGTKEYYIFEVTKILEEINSLLESKSDLKTIFKVNFKCSKAIDNFSIYSTKKMKDYRYEKL